MPVHAQTPSFSPPALPPLPGFPSVTAPSAPAPKTNTASTMPAATSPLPPDLEALAKKKETEKEAAAKPKNLLADLPPPVPESSELAVVKPDAAPKAPALPTAKMETNVATPVAALAPPDGLVLPLPELPGAGAKAPALVLPLPPALAPLEADLPAVEAKTAVPKLKSWQTVLAPAVVPMETRFNYRRQILPPTISRTRYSRDNGHLPRAVMREDYAELLVNRAAVDDLEATRALLNAGADSKEAALAAARISGATRTEQLLLARGAR